VVGIPKTIDNDVAFVSRTFGYLTAVEESCRVIDGAHREAHSVLNGISLVKLMGRAAGFIAAGATVASQDVNFTLIPEVPFKLEGPGGFLAALKDRLSRRAHAVVVVAEGAGQDLLAMNSGERDASNSSLRFRSSSSCLKYSFKYSSSALPTPIAIIAPEYDSLLPGGRGSEDNVVKLR
jgi:6-phosphofructokinase 1